MTVTRSNMVWLMVMGALLIVAAIARLSVGSGAMGLPHGDYASVIWEARSHRLCIGITVGVALAVSGVALQALLRNPLAEPFILGLSTGAGAGIMLQAYVAHVLAWQFMGGQTAGALVGAGLSMSIVFAVGRRHGLIDPVGLLLTGVVLSTLNAALIMLLNYMIGPGGVRDDMAQWMMGYLHESTAASTVGFIATLTVLGTALLFSLARAMDVATLSPGEAESVGVNLTLLRTVLFITAGTLAAGAVVLAGPIAFVGLICPHVARLMLGPGHRALLIGAALLGAALIVAADTVSSWIAFQLAGFGLLPIGILTAMLGGPVFLAMLHPKLGRGYE